MTGEKDDDKRPNNGNEGDDDKTVFAPASGMAGDASGVPVAADPDESANGHPDFPADDHSTPNVAGDWASPAPAADPQAPHPVEQAPPVVPVTHAPTVPPGFQTSFAPRADGQGIQVGDVLNHIFEVKRFIARGGMGEVFEGANVNSEERVAIKVMLPSLAADPSVISMFRKEARTLTRLQHEALVQYRVLAQEPQLGVLYIVTEYIDGTNLADVLAELSPSSDDLLALLRRLASGLRAAHALGAIHRDISPDNVLLADGRLAEAKIIDFGIAKDLDPGSATIVGDGFAGKLNYVAPEQLGDFGRQIGPWTDVYSLGLVMLAVAQGRNVAMGGSLVDAVDKRRAGVDLTGAPDALRPVLARMLQPNPVERLQSMDAVLAELDRRVAPPPPPPPPGARGGGVPMAWIGGGIAALLVLALGFWLLLGSGEDGGTPAEQGPTLAAVDPVARARSAIDSTLPSVACTWLGVVDISEGDAGPLVKLTGVAGNPAAAQAELSRAMTAAAVDGASLDFAEVSPITQAGCAALDAYRQIRSPDTRRLTVPQRSFEMRMQPDDPALSGYPGEIAANTVIEIDIGDPQRDFAMVGLEPSGVIDADFFDAGTVANRQLFDDNAGTRNITTLGSDKYRLQLEVNHAGWSGILLLTGQGPFDADLIAPPLGARGPDWTNRFVSTAASRGWQADMVWFKTVDEVRE